eukprot:COSAG01_NODE_216_length_21695_cov_83.368772_16_plen_76_part_00
MPTYEYRCSGDCGVFELFQSMKDDAITSCPACQKSVTRLISRGVGVQFAGAGFYVNDVNQAESKSNSKSNKKSND